MYPGMVCIRFPLSALAGRNSFSGDYQPLTLFAQLVRVKLGPAQMIPGPNGFGSLSVAVECKFTLPREL